MTIHALGVRTAGNHLDLIPFLCFPVHPVIGNILDAPGVGLMGIRSIVGPVPMIIRTIMDIPLRRFLCRRAGDSLNNLLRIIGDSAIGKYTF